MNAALNISLPEWLTVASRECPPLATDEARMRFVVDLSRRNVETRSGGPFAPRSCRRSACCARLKASTSAWAAEQLLATTRLVAAATSRPDSISNTAAANGPPLRVSTLRRDSSTTKAMRASADARGRQAAEAAESHGGSSTCNTASMASIIALFFDNNGPANKEASPWPTFPP
jgi:hypothetical protein